MTINFETSKLAKEKGYNIETEAYYTENGDLFTDINFLSLQQSKPENCYYAPTQSNLQKWLREKHNLHVEVVYNPVFIENEHKNYYPVLKAKENVFYIQYRKINGMDYKYFPKCWFVTYEDCLELGLLELLKTINND